MKIRDFFSTFNISAVGLSSQKNQLAVTAENIANATTTRTSDGKPYKRKFVVKEALTGENQFSGLLSQARTKLSRSSAHHISRSSFASRQVAATGQGRINSKVEESSDFKQIYDPGHPDANEKGFVEYPNINVVNEMMELIASSRIYEANITMMNATKNLAKRSLEI